jgi:hypothetical protein
MPQLTWLDIFGTNLVGASMRSAARAAVPGYDNSFVLAMIASKALGTFPWNGIHWTVGLALQRLAPVPAAALLALAGALFFDRFDPQAAKFKGKTAAEPGAVETSLPAGETCTGAASIRLSRLGDPGFQSNLLRLAWLELLLLVKGLRWYWWAGLAGLWVGCAFIPTENLRRFGYMLLAAWPVLVWSRLGERETRWGTGLLLFQDRQAALRLLLPAWLAGVLFSAAVTGAALAGRLVYGEPAELTAWILAVIFIPALALALGVWSGSSKPFEAIYPILWYLGPFNPQNQLAVLDYLGLHRGAPAHTAPALFAGFTTLLLAAAWLGRVRQARNS